MKTCNTFQNYKEDLLQWIWEHKRFSFAKLKLVTGESLKILKSGNRNSGAGPDFKNASLIISDLKWHGDVEIHVDEESWFSHKHHLDPNYNSVVLHVVYKTSGSGKRALRSDQTFPFTFDISNAIQMPLHRLMSSKQSGNLECSGNISFINPEAFKKQVEKAGKEYFFYKTGQLMKFYEPSLPPSQAILKMLVTSLYDSLGVPHNRSGMLELCSNVFGKYPSQKEMPPSIHNFIEEVQHFAFSGKPGVCWQPGAGRPYNHPANRVKQAAAFHYIVMVSGPGKLLKNGISCWKVWCDELPQSSKPGSQTLQMLFQTVFLPALYLAGQIFHSDNLMKTSYHEWQIGQINTPGSIIKIFRKAGFNPDTLKNEPGLVHHYKRYCSEKNCTNCEVFKKAIIS